jgi:formiminotetrahydrofolate cyclodeaminase
MPQWGPIVYREFHDVPRVIMVSDGTRNYLFDSVFDEALDEYRDSYDIYEMPKLSEEEMKSSWLKIEQRALRHLGRVPVKEVSFDSTKRRELDLSILEHLKTK